MSGYGTELCQRWLMWHKRPYPRTCEECGLRNACQFGFDLKAIPKDNAPPMDPPKVTGWWNGNGRNEFAPPSDGNGFEIRNIAPTPSRQSIDDRLECLRLATETAKHTGAYDAITAAERYYRFATGQSVEDEVSGLTFKQRLDALTREFLRDERSDQRKMLHEMREYVKSYEMAFGDLNQEQAESMTDEQLRDLVRRRYSEEQSP